MLEGTLRALFMQINELTYDISYSEIIFNHTKDNELSYWKIRLANNPECKDAQFNYAAVLQICSKMVENIEESRAVRALAEKTYWKLS